MKKKQSKRYPVIKNPELEIAIKGFKPEFKNDQDISIMKRLGTLNAMLPTVDNELLRRTGKAWAETILTSKMVNIIQRERSLIESINKRNMDF